LGHTSKVQICIYDKGKELRSQKSNILKEAFFVERCIGEEWINSGRPITRVEIRLGREALKCLGVNTVSDLKGRERGIVDLLTRDWFRILENTRSRKRRGITSNMGTGSFIICQIFFRRGHYRRKMGKNSIHQLRSSSIGTSGIRLFIESISIPLRHSIEPSFIGRFSERVG
jgi:hypothetical protein